MSFNSPTIRISSQPSSSCSGRQFAGILQQKNQDGDIVTGKRIYTGHELIIGRDATRCQYVIDEPVVSNKHVRIYTVVYDKDKPTEFPPLVYAEDLSRNGTYWNSSLIGKGNGGFLLSEGDTLRISAKTYFTFKGCTEDVTKSMFDLVQEKEMEHFRTEYIITDRLLGSGAFGRVFMAIEQCTRTQLACKVVDLRKLRPQSRTRIGRLEQPAAAEDVDSRIQLRKVKAWVDRQNRDCRLEKKLKIYYREAEILATLNHPNIIGLEKVYVTDNNMYMFTDLVTAGDLFSYLEHKNGRLLEVEAAVIVRQMLIALKFLHERNIIHRDLKPDNILMTSLAAGSRVVLTDFGAARRMQTGQERMSTLVGTVGYTAPEILEQHKTSAKTGYTRSVDMWSLGCLTVLLLTGGLAFVDPRTDNYSEKLAKECDLTSLNRSSEWQQVRSKPKEFVKKLLVKEEQKRITANHALRHEWFSNELHKTNFEELYQRTIRHWRPRILKQPVIEFADADSIKRLPCFQEILDSGKQARQRNGYQMPVEPPYKPFPRKMHIPLWPKRASGLRTMSEEVKTAIKEKWTPRSGSDSSSEAGGDRLPPLTPQPAPGGSNSKFMRTDTLVGNQRSNIMTSPNRAVTPRSKTFKQLHPRTYSTGSTEEQEKRKNSGGDCMVNSIEQAENPPTVAPRSRAFSPSAWASSACIRQWSKAPQNEPNDTAVTAQLTPNKPKSRIIPLRPVLALSDSQIHTSKDDSNTAVFTQPVQNLAQREDVCEPTELQGAMPIKENSKLKLRFPSVLRHGPTVAPNSSKKRRRSSIFDFDDEDDKEDELAGSEPKRPRASWQPAKTLAMRVGGGSNALLGDIGQEAVDDVRSRSTDEQPYLPRL